MVAPPAMLETQVPSPGDGNGNPLQYSCLGNPMDIGAYWATIHGVSRVRHDLAIKPPKGLFRFFVHFLTGLFVYLENNPLSVVSFAIIFSHSEGCLFTLSVVSFAMQKLLSLIRSHLFIFAFISIILGGESEDLAVIYVLQCSACFFL